MKFKKLAGVLAAVVMAASLSACGGSASQPAPAPAPAPEPAKEAAPAEEAPAEEAAAGFDKDFTIICPYGAGGGTDLAMRIMADVAETTTGKTITVENVTGGSGVVGLTETLSRDRDGYTLTLYSPDLINLDLLGLAPADINPDAFKPICTINGEPAAIIVPADAKWNTIEEFVEDAKANPGQIQLANAGMGNIWHLAAIGVELQTGASFNHIPYDKGTSESLPALLGGHVDAVVCSVAEAASNIAAGELKVLAVCNNERLAGYPDIPTMKESGIDLTVVAMRALGVSADCPDDVTAAVAAAFSEAVASDAAKEACETSNLTYMPLDAAGTGALLDSMKPNFEAIISAYLEQAQ